MHDLRYEKVSAEGKSALLPAKLIEYARQLNLEVEEFTHDLENERFVDKIARDYEDGNAYGVQGVPVVFINGRLVAGVQSYETYAYMIAEELQNIRN